MTSVQTKVSSRWTDVHQGNLGSYPDALSRRTACLGQMEIMVTGMRLEGTLWEVVHSLSGFVYDLF